MLAKHSSYDIISYTYIEIGVIPTATLSKVVVEFCQYGLKIFCHNYEWIIDALGNYYQLSCANIQHFFYL